MCNGRGLRLVQHLPGWVGVGCEKLTHVCPRFSRRSYNGSMDHHCGLTWHSKNCTIYCIRERVQINGRIAREAGKKLPTSLSVLCRSRMAIAYRQLCDDRR